MTQVAVTTASPLANEPSDRVRLARTALEAALAVPGVVRGEPNGGVPRVTWDGATRLDGVLAIADPGGRYEIDLRLVAELVPLHALADAIRSHVRRAAAHAGLDASLGAIDVEFADLLTAEEIVSAARAEAQPMTDAGWGVEADR